MTLRRIAGLLLALAFAAGCRAPGRSVRAWVEARDESGHSVAGATVAVDGRLVGITDHRGLFRVKIRRRVGTPVALMVVEEASPVRSWTGSFTVGTNGGPAGNPSGRILAVLRTDTAAAKKAASPLPALSPGARTP